MYRFADVYGANAYNSGTYACDAQQQTGTGCTAGASTGGGSSSSSSSNPLADTGMLVGLIVGVAALLLLVIVLVRFWRRPAKSANKPQVAAAHHQSE